MAPQPTRPPLTCVSPCPVALSPERKHPCDARPQPSADVQTPSEHFKMCLNRRRIVHRALETWGRHRTHRQTGVHRQRAQRMNVRLRELMRSLLPRGTDLDAVQAEAPAQLDRLAGLLRYLIGDNRPPEH